MSLRYPPARLSGEEVGWRFGMTRDEVRIVSSAEIISRIRSEMPAKELRFVLSGAGLPSLSGTGTAESISISGWYVPTTFAAGLILPPASHPKAPRANRRIKRTIQLRMMPFGVSGHSGGISPSITGLAVISSSPCGLMPRPWGVTWASICAKIGRIVCRKIRAPGAFAISATGRNRPGPPANVAKLRRMAAGLVG